MDAIGITIDLSRYKGTVHYTTCGLWTGYSAHTNRFVPLSIKMKMCKVCKPKTEDVVKVAQDIIWAKKWKVPGGHVDAMSKLSGGGFNDQVERLHVQRQLNGGRTLRLPAQDRTDE